MSRLEAKRQRRQRRKDKRSAQRVSAIQAADNPDFVFSISDEIDASGEGAFELITAAEGETKPPGFEMQAYTGGQLDLPNYYYPVVVDLEGMTGPRRATPILRDHKIGQIVGHGRAVIAADGITITKGVFSGGGQDSEEVLTAARAGFPWQASIGARPTQMVMVDKGEKVTVNGRSFTGPLYVARKSQLKEVSFVAIGADRGGASATLTAKAQTQGSETMKFSEWLTAKGLDESKLDADSLKALKAMYEADIQAQGSAGGDDTDGDDTDGNVNAGGNAGFRRAVGNDGATTTPDWLVAQRRQQGEEARRVERIHALANSADAVPTVRINAAGQHDPEGTTEVPFVSHAISAGWSAQEAELALLRSARPAAQQSGRRSDITAANGAVIEAALCLSAGIPADIMQNGVQVPLVAAGLPQQQREQVLNQAMEARFQSFGLHALMDEVIIASGSLYRGDRKTDAFIRAAMGAEQMLRASGSSTISLSGILSNLANKLMLAAYQQQEVTWRDWCAVGSNRDFKATTRYRLTEAGAFKKVGADGELKHVTLGEASYSSQLETYGMIIALNRQMMINDDLGAFSEIPMFIGQEAAIRVEEAAYVLLLSNAGSFFHADNKNLMSGGGSALSVAALTTMKSKFRNQVTPNGKPLLAAPRILLVPTTLEDTARRLLESEMLLEAATAGSPTGEKNPHKGTLKMSVSPYLNNTAITDQDGNAITGQSDTHFYSFCDPARIAAKRVSFLNGRQVPVIESSDAEFETLGMKWRGYLDFAVADEDPKAAQRSAGA